MRQKKIDDQKERYHATVHKKKSKRKIVAVSTPVRKAPSSSHLKKKNQSNAHTHTHTTERARYRLRVFLSFWIHSGIEDT